MSRRDDSKHEEARVYARIARVLHESDYATTPQLPPNMRKAYARLAARSRRLPTKLLVEPHEQAAERYAEAAEILEHARAAAERAALGERIETKLRDAAAAYAESAAAERRAAHSGRLEVAELHANPGPFEHAEQRLTNPDDEAAAEST